MTYTRANCGSPLSTSPADTTKHQDEFTHHSLVLALVFVLTFHLSTIPLSSSLSSPMLSQAQAPRHPIPTPHLHLRKRLLSYFPKIFSNVCLTVLTSSSSRSTTSNTVSASTTELFRFKFHFSLKHKSEQYYSNKYFQNPSSTAGSSPSSYLLSETTSSSPTCTSTFISSFTDTGSTSSLSFPQVPSLMTRLLFLHLRFQVYFRSCLSLHSYFPHYPHHLRHLHRYHHYSHTIATFIYYFFSLIILHHLQLSLRIYFLLYLPPLVFLLSVGPPFFYPKFIFCLPATVIPVTSLQLENPFRVAFSIPMSPRTREVGEFHLLSILCAQDNN